MTLLEKFGELEARLTAKSITIYWGHQFAFGMTSGFPYESGRVVQIRAGEIHVKVNDANFSVPLFWICESILNELWCAYKEECKESLPPATYKEIMRGLE